jgi:glycosyltransferase involved in cell wall biosynthesis
MKTVLHLSSSSGPGGAERVACAIAASLDPAKYRSLVGLFRPGWLKDQCECRGLATYVMSNDGFMNWKWMRECYQLVKKERVDLIQAHEFDAIVHGWVVAKMAGIPLVATVHGKIYFWERVRRRWAYRFVSRSTTMVTVSEDLKRFIVKQTGMPEGRVQVIYNGVDAAPTPDTAQVVRCRRDLQFPDEDLVVGIVGNLYPIKGHRYLLEAIPQILKACPKTTFIFIGRGELDVSLKAKAKELGIDEKVRFLGLRQDVPILLAVMDVFVMPSLSEGLSIALLEAMACGKPVVVTQVGGNPEVVVQGSTGILVPSENPPALAEALTALLADTEMRRQYGEQGRRRQVDLFSLNAMTRAYEQSYDRVLAGVA